MIMATAAMCSLIRSYMLSASETENIEQVIIEQSNFKAVVRVSTLEENSTTVFY